MSEAHAIKPSSGSSAVAGRAPAHRYNAALANKIEARWQDFWDANQTFHSPNPGESGFDSFIGAPKKYILDMFPYPSGAGLHVGHPLGYIATDIFARFSRMTGHNVLHAMGYDAFGLPAEQFAVQTGQHPRVTTETNIANMRRQLRRLGLGHDAARSVATTDVAFYKWTQWIFLQIFNSWFDERENRARPISELIGAFESGDLEPECDEISVGKPWAALTDNERRAAVDAHRLAYLSEAPVNWCPALGTVLANEEVTADGKSERGNHPVYKRPLKQWKMRITKYAERLLEDIERVDWPEPIKLMQRNWIGRSEGAHVSFELSAGPIVVFTTRPDTLFGATYMVLAPEHSLVDKLVARSWPQEAPEKWRGHEQVAKTPRDAVAAYRAFAASKSDVERQVESRKKTGVFTGAYATNPVNGESIPIFIADYVLMAYGTGAIMAVPAHDQRDFEFAEQFGLPIRDVVYPRAIHAASWFLTQAPATDFPMGWELALADFVGFVTAKGASVDEYPQALMRIAKQRKALEDPDGVSAVDTPDRPGGVGAQRGVVQQQWLETLANVIELGRAGATKSFEKARYTRLVGAASPEPGIAVNSPVVDGLPTGEAKHRMIDWLEEKKFGSRAINYKLRDWLFSRQRYWGEPFPIVYDESGRPIALRESMLPVELPEIDDYAPRVTDDETAAPEPPLGRAKEWRTVTLDLGEGPKQYTRELNTMPQWAGSCWYYLRYLDPANDELLCSSDVERYWMLSRKDGAPASTAAPFDPDQHHFGGVDLYVGGAEHAVLHLLYARFWHKILFDLGHISTPEPFGKLFNQGYIQAPAFTDERGVYVEAAEVEAVAGTNDQFTYQGKPVTREFGKMGKSLRNIIPPDEICHEYGADTLRLYEMYMGPLDASKPWNTRDIVGVHRFLQRVWRNFIDEETGDLCVASEGDAACADDETQRLLHKTIAGVRKDFQSLAFNTAIAKLIELNNHLTQVVAEHGALPVEVATPIAQMLAPLAPHIAEELWSRMGHEKTIAFEPFPEADAALLVEATIEIPIQILGKVRSKITIAADADPNAVEEAALADERVQKFLEGKTVRKVIVVPGRTVNIVAN